MLRNGNKSVKAWHGAQNRRVAVLVIFLMLILTATILFLGNKVGKPNSWFNLQKLKWNSCQSSVQFHPTLEFRNGTEVIWQIPDSPKAVVFLAHGCNGTALNFWDRSPSCPNCIGLPEERLIVLQALSQKFAVLTISSPGGCWSIGKEIVFVKEIIRWWVDKNKLQKLSLMAMGVSAGGEFVSVLAANMRFSSITLMIAKGRFEEMDVPEDYPPTLFVHMPKDRATMRMIGAHTKALKQKGISVAEIKCMEFPLSPNFLAERIPCLDQNISVKLFELFREKGFINENGYMRSDGRATPWKEAARERTILPDEYEWVPHIQEELNLAYAYHGTTSLQSEQIFEWFESHMSLISEV